MKISLLTLFSFISIAIAQNGIQLSVEAGYINYLDNAKSSRETINYPMSDGGVDVALQFKKYKSKHFFTGFKGGYSILNVDEENLQSQFAELNSDYSSMKVSTDPTQQLNASIGLGLCLPIAQDKFEFETAFFGGLGWIRTGEESLEVYDDQNELSGFWQASNANSLSYMINPQMNMNFYVGNVLQIKVTGNYYFSEYVYDQQINSTLTPSTSQEVQLKFSAFSAVAGIALRI